MNRFFHRYRKAIVWTVAIGFALSIFGMGMLQRFSPAEPGTAEETIVSVAGRELTRQQLGERYERLVNQYIQMYEMYGLDFTRELRGADGSFRRQQLVAEATENFIRTALLAQEARRLRISVPSQEVDAAFDQQYGQYLEQVDGDEALLEQYLTVQGMTLQDFQRELRAAVERELENERLRRTVVGEIEPTEEELEEYYAEHRERYREEPERIRVGYIQVQDAALADRLLAEVGAEDADWSALAEEHSLHEETREAGGETDWFSYGESGLSSQVESVAFDLEVGRITLVGEGDYQHIVKLLERQGPVYAPLEDVRDEVRESYVAEQRERKWDEWYRDLRRAANVEIRDLLVKAFVSYRQDNEAGLEVLEQSYDAGEVVDLNVQFYLGRMHESVRNDALGRVSQLEELDEPSAEEESRLEAAREAAARHREAALDYYLRFAGTGEADESVLQRILSLDPDQTIARYRMGEVYREQGEYVQAREQYERALEVDPDFVGAYVGLGDVAMAEGLFGRATGYYEEALDRDPDSLSLKVKLAGAHLGDGSFDRAEELLQEVLAEDERNVTALTLMGDVLMEKGDAAGALERYQAAFARNPTSQVQLKRARALAAVGREADAEAAFRDLTRQFPYRPEGYVGLGDIYREQGEDERAVEQYRLGLRQAPDVGTREEIARRIVELRPDDVDMRFRLAGFLRDQGRTAAAMEQYEMIIEVDPGNIHAFLGLGDGYMAQGGYDEAIEQYERALGVAESRAEKLAVYDKLVAGDEERVGSEEPLTAVGLEALWQRALLRHEAGEVERARSDLQRIHNTDPGFRADELVPLLDELGGEVRSPEEELDEGESPGSDEDGSVDQE